MKLVIQEELTEGRVPVEEFKFPLASRERGLEILFCTKVENRNGDTNCKLTFCEIFRDFQRLATHFHYQTNHLKRTDSGQRFEWWRLAWPFRESKTGVC